MRYWKRCEIAENWEERMGQIEDMGLVPPTKRKDSMARVREAKEKQKAGSSRYSPPPLEEDKSD